VLPEIRAPPPSDQPLQLLCEDHNGTYLLPFESEWRDGAWYNVTSPKGANPLDVTVVDGDRRGGRESGPVNRSQILVGLCALVPLGLLAISAVGLWHRLFH
jgi:hypothetical protein